MSRHHHRTVVKRVHPYQMQIRLLTLSLIGVMLAGLGFWYGLKQGQYQPVPLVDEVDDLRAAMTALETQTVIEQQVIDALRGDLADSRASIDELERELAFYREVMAPEEVTQGMVLRTPVFRAGAEVGEWRYQLVVQQGGARNKPVHKGDVFVTLWGYAGGQPGSFTLNELDETLTAEGLSLSFRYFQRFEGTLQLPPGFEPDRIEVQLDVVKPNKDVIEYSFDWAEITKSAPNANNNQNQPTEAYPQPAEDELATEE